MKSQKNFWYQSQFRPIVRSRSFVIPLPTASRATEGQGTGHASHSPVIIQYRGAVRRHFLPSACAGLPEISYLVGGGK